MWLWGLFAVMMVVAAVFLLVYFLRPPRRIHALAPVARVEEVRGSETSPMRYLAIVRVFDESKVATGDWQSLGTYESMRAALDQIKEFYGDLIAGPNRYLHVSYEGLVEVRTFED